jgi:hypothetical protein
MDYEAEARVINDTYFAIMSEISRDTLFELRAINEQRRMDANIQRQIAYDDMHTRYLALLRQCEATMKALPRPPRPDQLQSHAFAGLINQGVTGAGEANYNADLIATMIQGFMEHQVVDVAVLFPYIQWMAVNEFGYAFVLGRHARARMQLCGFIRRVDDFKNIWIVQNGKLKTWYHQFYTDTITDIFFVGRQLYVNSLLTAWCIDTTKDNVEEEYKGVFWGRHNGVARVPNDGAWPVLWQPTTGETETIERATFWCMAHGDSHWLFAIDGDLVEQMAGGVRLPPFDPRPDVYDIQTWEYAPTDSGLLHLARDRTITVWMRKDGQLQPDRFFVATNAEAQRIVARWVTSHIYVHMEDDKLTIHRWDPIRWTFTESVMTIPGLYTIAIYSPVVYVLTNILTGAQLKMIDVTVTRPFTNNSFMGRYYVTRAVADQ